MQIFNMGERVNLHVGRQLRASYQDSLCNPILDPMEYHLCCVVVKRLSQIKEIAGSIPSRGHTEDFKNGSNGFPSVHSGLWG